MAFFPDSKAKNRIRGSARRLTPGSASQVEKQQDKSVLATISERKAGLKTDKEKTEDEEQREDTVKLLCVR